MYYVTGVHAKTNYTLNTNLVANNLVVSEIWKGMMGSQIHSSLICQNMSTKLVKRAKNCSDNEMCIAYFKGVWLLNSR